jgi:hypothetical protein
MKFQMMGDEKSGKNVVRKVALLITKKQWKQEFFSCRFFTEPKSPKKCNPIQLRTYVEIGGTLEQLFFFLLLWTAESPTLPQVLR